VKISQDGGGRRLRRPPDCAAPRLGRPERSASRAAIAPYPSSSDVEGPCRRVPERSRADRRGLTDRAISQARCDQARLACRQTQPSASRTRSRSSPRRTARLHRSSSRTPETMEFDRLLQALRSSLSSSRSQSPTAGPGAISSAMWAHSTARPALHARRQPVSSAVDPFVMISTGRCRKAPDFGEALGRQRHRIRLRTALPGVVASTPRRSFVVKCEVGPSPRSSYLSGPTRRA